MCYVCSSLNTNNTQAATLHLHSNKKIHKHDNDNIKNVLIRPNVIQDQCPNLKFDNTARDHSHLWLAPWLWALWALCTSSSSLERSSSSCSTVSGECCCLLTRMISCSRASFSRKSCMKSRSRSASARPDQLSLSSCASWCCMLCTLREQCTGHEDNTSLHAVLFSLHLTLGKN